MKPSNSFFADLFDTDQSLPKAMVVFFLALALLLFVGNMNTPLWDQDEAAYAGFAKTMLETGDYAIPDFPYSEIHRKPPLHFWLTALSFEIFGTNEWAMRLFSSLSILGGIFLFWRWGTPVFGIKETRLATLILGSSFLVISLGKVAVTDGTLFFCMMLTALSLLRFLKTPHWYFLLGFWGGIALGILVKGPSILIFGGGIWASIFLLDKVHRKALWKTHPWFGLPLAVAPFLLYLYWTSIHDNGVFAAMLWDWYVLQRIGLGSDDTVLNNWSGPPGYYLLTIVLAFFPFLPFFFQSLWRFVKQKNLLSSDKWIWAWMIGAWFLWEILPSKLPAYAIGVHPIIALLLAKWFLAQLPLKKAPSSLKLTTVLWGGLVFLAVMLVFSFGFKLLGQSAVPTLAITGMFLWISVLVILILVYMNKWRLYLGGLVCFGIGFQMIAWGIIVPFLVPFLSATKTLATQVEEPNSNVELFTSSRPPSAILYLRNAGHQPEVISNRSEAIQKIKEGENIMLFDEKALDFLGGHLPDSVLTAVKEQSKVFPSFLTDRGEMTSFYLWER